MTSIFKKARLGAVAMEACGTCSLGTGVVLIKKRGNPQGPEYVGPRLIQNPEARCEFCTFLGMWMASEKIDPKETGLKYGAAKLITRDPKSGVDTLIAFVPFDEREAAENKGNLADGKEFQWSHGLVIRAEKDVGTMMKLMEILK